MIGTVVLAAAAAFFGWIAWTTNEPVVAGLFLVGAVISAACAVVWYFDARQLRRSTRC